MNDETCPAEEAGYDGMFGIYCELPVGHAGAHQYGDIAWTYLEPGTNTFTFPHRP